MTLRILRHHTSIMTLDQMTFRVTYCDLESSKFQSLALNLKPRILTTDTVTPISLLDSSFTGNANSLIGTPNISTTDQTSFYNFENETNADCKGTRTRTVSNRQSIKSGQTTPIMIDKTPIYLNEIKEMKGTDFKRC